MLLTTSAVIGGMERVTLGLARALALRCWDVQTVFAPPTDRREFSAWCEAQGVVPAFDRAVRQVVEPHRLTDVAALQHLVRMSKPEVVSIHYGGGHIPIKDVLAVRLATRQRCFISVHSTVPWSVAGERKRTLTRLAAALVSGVICPSRAIRQIVIEAGVPRRKVHVVYNGIATPAPLPTREESRAQLAIPRDRFVIGAVSRLVPEKGMDDLVEAVGRLAAASSDVQLLIAGDGPERARLEAFARGRIGARAIFLGALADPGLVYAASDVCARSSHVEGFGIVFLEAALFGVPGIGTRVGGIPEAIVDGRTGVLVRPRAPAELASAIERLRNDGRLRHRLGAAARERVLAEFTDEGMARGYERLFCSAGAAAPR
ncbi:MAG TPA: glycosyltransferase family 4 protein [Acetobacteraceae bacterium]|nr:glycosyltransferase family 4 protein [Acetobacteraceae bacterium]